MIPVLALPRLSWRPAILFLALPLALAILWPITSLGAGGTPVRQIWAGDASAPVRSAVWHLAILVSTVVGLALALLRLELQHARFSWLLPGARGGLFIGTLAVALTVAGGVAMLAVRTMPALTAVAIFAAAMCCHVAAAAIVDAAVPRATRWAAGLALVLAAVAPGPVGSLAGQWPLPMTVLAGGLAALGFAFLFSKRAARTRYLRWSMAAPAFNTPLYWEKHRDIARSWHVDLATDRLGPWLLAARYEFSSLTRFSPWLVFLALAILGVPWSHVTNMPHLVLVYLGMCFWILPHRLHSTMLYPLSRRRRARLAVVGATLDAHAPLAIFIAVLLVVKAVEVPALEWFNDGALQMDWIPLFAMAWAWAPVAQWSSIRNRGGTPRGAVTISWIKMAGSLLAYSVLSTGSVVATRGLEPIALAAVTFAIAVTVHAIHWIAVHRHFARADLVAG